MHVQFFKEIAYKDATQRNAPFNVGGVRDMGETVLRTRWGPKTVVITDDPSYDFSGYITLIIEGQRYDVPGFIEGDRFHDDASYTQFLPLAAFSLPGFTP